MKFHEKKAATLSMMGVWNNVIFKIPFYSSHSMILWNVILPPKLLISTKHNNKNKNRNNDNNIINNK